MLSRSPPSTSVRLRAIDARTEHLIALVMDGTRLRDAARAYGISGERVRQLLNEVGINARDLPGREERPKRGGSELAQGLAPMIEAMWLEGMLCHEIARVLDISCEAVYRLICERLPDDQRGSRAAGRLEDARSSEARLLAGVRRAASVLTESSVIKGKDRRRAQAVISGWLAAYSQLTCPVNVAPRSNLAAEASDAAAPAGHVNRTELGSELERFRAALRASGLSGSTVHAYLVGASLFVRWLAGDYVPRGVRQSALTRRAVVPP